MSSLSHLDVQQHRLSLPPSVPSPSSSSSLTLSVGFTVSVSLSVDVTWLPSPARWSPSRLSSSSSNMIPPTAPPSPEAVPELIAFRGSESHDSTSCLMRSSSVSSREMSFSRDTEGLADRCFLLTSSSFSPPAAGSKVSCELVGSSLGVD